MEAKTSPMNSNSPMAAKPAPAIIAAQTTQPIFFFGGGGGGTEWG